MTINNYIDTADSDDIVADIQIMCLKYYDCKGENIMVDQDGEFRLIDPDGIKVTYFTSNGTV